MNTSQSITGVTVSHNTTSVTVFEQLTSDSCETQLTGLHSHSDVSECFILRTCSRVEAYVVTDDYVTGENVLRSYFDTMNVDSHGEWLSHAESIQHLMRVAAGIESIVVGEDHVLGQLKRAYNTAVETDVVDSVLEDVVLKAIHVGQQARTTTEINEGVVSMSSAAVHAVQDQMTGAVGTVLVIGAGKISLQAVEHISEHADHVIIANRTIGNAEAAATYAAPGTQTTVISLRTIPRVFPYVDAVITATGSEEFIIEESNTPSHTETVIVDIAQPPDVDPAVTAILGVSRIGIDELNEMQREAREERRDAIAAVERLIAREYDQFVTQYKRERADGVIQGMYEGAERIKQQEVQEALSQLEHAHDKVLTNVEKEVIRAMADSLVNQLLAAPTESLRDAAADDDWETIATAIQLFDPGTTNEHIDEDPPIDLQQHNSTGVAEQNN